MNLTVNDLDKVARIFDWTQEEWDQIKDTIPWNYRITFEPMVQDIESIANGRQVYYEPWLSYESEWFGSTHIVRPIQMFMQTLLPLDSDPNVVTDPSPEAASTQ